MTDNRFSGVIGQEYELFRRAIPHYDEMQQIVGKVIAENIETAPYKVLEIGCGTGHTTRALLADPRVHVTAIDNEPVMIEQAKKPSTIM